MVSMQERYDVVIVGAGHAGCEAARACARIGLKAAMVTMNLDLIAQMSCNPAIGGIAKGQPGARDRCARRRHGRSRGTASAFSFVFLNTSRGPPSGVRVRRWISAFIASACVNC